MIHLPFGATADDFRWGTGIEDTFVPQTRRGMRSLDEYELMGHYDQWRDDLALVKPTGARMIRWGIPWYRVEPQPGQFDWSWTDQVIPYIVEELGLELILDLMHYGTPSWLDGSFVDPRYPEAVAAYARAVVERYGRYLRYYTPLNEPLVNARMCGMRGKRPPYLTGETGFLSVVIALVKGMQRTIRTIQELDPQAVMIHVEAAGLTRSARSDLQHLAVHEQHRGYLVYDLLTGRVDHDHPLYGWIVQHSVTPADLAAIAADRVPIDVMGLNFYPQWSTKQVLRVDDGKLRTRNVEHSGAGFSTMIADFYDRYRVPIMITETSAKGSLAIKRRWLRRSVAAIKELRGNGVPVIGYIWFPLFTMVKWEYRTGRRPLNDYLIDLGLYEGEIESNGNVRYVATELVDAFRSMTAAPEQFVGDLNMEVQSSFEAVENNA